MGVRLGGRKKGTPNKRTSEVMAIAERLNCNPFEILCLFAKGDWRALGVKKTMPEDPDPQIDLGLRVRAAGEAAKYLYAQKRELSTGDEPIQVSIVDYTGKRGS